MLIEQRLALAIVTIERATQQRIAPAILDQARDPEGEAHRAGTGTERVLQRHKRHPGRLRPEGIAT